MAAEFHSLHSPDIYVSDTEVDAVVSQAIDSAALEQISAINLSGLPASSSLPSNLEARFQKLKSFPVAHNSQPVTAKESTTTTTRSLNRRRKSMPALAGDDHTGPLEESADRDPDGKRIGQPREPSLSPPRQACCFPLSAKKATKKKKKNKSSKLEGLQSDDRQWARNDDMLTDLSTFSFKEQQRKLKEALKEEERASREAAKVVEWVKQASARIDVSAIHELLSEDEESYK